MPTASPSSAALVTVSIVSHAQWDLVQVLLRQLDAHCHATIARAVLTINTPETLGTMPATQFPVEVIHNPRPQGFGANHNAALQHCATDWFLVLNPDVRIDHNVLQALLAQARPNAGLLTPRIMEPAKQAPEPHRALLTPREILCRSRPGYQPPTIPTWIPGLFMLFRAAPMQSLGGFDARRYFMYGEDFDICARLRLLGWQIQVAEDHTALHDARRASHANLQHLRWHLGSLAKVWLSPVFWRYARLLRQEAALGMPR